MARSAACKLCTVERPALTPTRRELSRPKRRTPYLSIMFLLPMARNLPAITAKGRKRLLLWTVGPDKIDVASDKSGSVLHGLPLRLATGGRLHMPSNTSACAQISISATVFFQSKYSYLFGGKVLQD